MLIKLGSKALDFDPRAGSLTEPLLWAQAARMYDAAPVGSALELRAALVYLGLSCAGLRGTTTQAAAAAGYDVARTGGLLWRFMTDLDMSPDDAPDVLRAALRARTEERAPAAVAAPVAAPVRRPTFADPFPGLTRNGETYPEFAMHGGGSKKSAADMSAMEEWRDAGEAWKAGTIREWLASDGAALGFVLEPAPGEG